MKNVLLFVTATLLVPLAVGCGGSSNKASTDMAVKGDMAVTECTKMASWPASNTAAVNNSTTSQISVSVFDQEPDATDSSKVNLLEYDFFGKPSAPPTLPHTYTYSSKDTFGTCMDCVEIVLDAQGAGDIYFAQSGSTTATKIDNTMPTGTVAASGMNLHFVHWDFASDQSTGMITMDKADPDGKCIDLASFSLSGGYDNTMTDM